jgi:hypothetical protein
MMTQKLLAAVGIAGALLLGAAAPAEAHGWGRPAFRPGPVYRAPIFRAPIFRAPVYHTPVYAPTYGVPVYGPAYAPAYGAPVYRGVDWRRAGWVRGHGHRW